MLIQMTADRFGASGTLYTKGNQYDLAADLAFRFIGDGVAFDVGTARESQEGGQLVRVSYNKLTGNLEADGAPVSGAGNALWANRATLVAAGTYSAFFTDIGVGGSFWFYSGGRWRPSAGRVVLKNLTSSVTHSTTTRTVMDYATLPAGLWQDGDVVEMEWCKTLTGTDTDTTETALSAVAATFSDAMNLTTAALTNTNPIVAARWRWRRLGATSVRPISISGSVGLGTAGAIPADPTVTTNLDTTDAYLQISGKLTTGGGPVTSLRAFTVTLICGS